MRPREIKHVGLHADRLSPDRDNPIEVAFAREWREQNNLSHTAAYLVQVPCAADDKDCIQSCCGGHVKKPFGDLTQEHATVMATLVQWLGSTCGMCFLREALGMAGYEIVRTKGGDTC